MISDLHAYLLPFVLTGNLDGSKKTHDHSKYAHAYVHRFNEWEWNLLNMDYWHGQSIDFYVDNIDTAAKERAFFRGVIECCNFRFNPTTVGTTLPYKLAQFAGDYCKRVFGEKITCHRGRGITNIGFSWELFAHLVFWTIYQDSDLYRPYNERIYKRFNLTRFLPELKKVAAKSGCQKMQVGAMLVVDGDIKKVGWNGHPKNTRRDNVCLRMNVPHGTDISVGYCIHAEENLLLRASPNQLRKGIVFITHPPCLICTKHLIQAGVPFVVFVRGDYPLYGPELAWDLGGKTRFYGV